MRWRRFGIISVLVAIALGISCSQEPVTQGKDGKTTNDGGSQVTPPDTRTSTPDTNTGQPDTNTNPPDTRTNPPDTNTNPPDTRTNPPDTNTTPDTNTNPPDTNTNPPEPTPEPPAPEPTPEPPAPKAQEIRFIMMGDTGTGSSKQKAVAQAIKRKCDAEAQPGGRGPCDFALLLGDNFYDVGVSSAQDSQFKTKFENMYSFLKFPFYITIGNHDYGIDKIGGVGAGFHKFKYYRDYAQTNSQFVFPDKYFAFKKGNATFLSLNTCELFFDGVPGVDVKAQRNFVRAELAKATQNQSVWKFAFGHHPYISNGTHGNAGKYEGIPFIPFVSGDSIKKFMENEICGKVDFYFAGHDHNIQLLKTKCGTNFLVHGAGAKTKKAGDTKRNPVWFQNYKDTGFTYVHIKGRSMTIEFHTASSASPVFSKTYLK